MKIHRIKYQDPNGIVRQQFASSDAEASKIGTQLKNDKRTIGKPYREPIDVPTDRAGLIAWLNANAVLVND